MFVSRAIPSTPSGHRFTSSAKFKTTRQVVHEHDGRQVLFSRKFSCISFSRNYIDRRRISELEGDKHPLRSLACASVSSIFCPILGKLLSHISQWREIINYVLGLIALFYAIRSLRAYRQGFFAEATVFYKKSVRWSLITFVLGLVIGSLVALSLFIKAAISV